FADCTTNAATDENYKRRLFICLFSFFDKLIIFTNKIGSVRKAMNITFKQIEAFLAVARTLSFSQAAAAVHLSQPALSANIHRLEQTLGARLFDRDTRTVSLSVVGREFVDVACGIANQ